MVKINLKRGRGGGALLNRDRTDKCMSTVQTVLRQTYIHVHDSMHNIFIATTQANGTIIECLNTGDRMNSGIVTNGLMEYPVYSCPCMDTNKHYTCACRYKHTTNLQRRR